jgi:hypothetical protein
MYSAEIIFHEWLHLPWTIYLLGGEGDKTNWEAIRDYSTNGWGNAKQKPDNWAFCAIWTRWAGLKQCVNCDLWKNWPALPPGYIDPVKPPTPPPTRKANEKLKKRALRIERVG